nr:reverse transcriptase, RNA-dependent DNA polymerase [Tanacetum cinerariifolium]
MAQKATRFTNPNYNIIVSRHVKFAKNAFPFGTNVKENIRENNDEIPYDVGEIQIESSEMSIESTDKEGSYADGSSIDSANEGERQHVEEINVDTKVGAFLAAINSNDEPKSFNQAVQDPNWRAAMQKEIEALEENERWSIEELPSGKKPIDSKWVYKIKYKPNGEIERYKARLVAKGFTQMDGVDYHDTFAPVATLVTLRTLLAIAVKRDWIVHQLDVNNAFFHRELNEKVYTKIPEGYEKGRVSEIIWMRWLLEKLRVKQIGPTPIYCDNQAARNIATNPVFHERTKHVEMDCYFVRERVDSQEVVPLPIHTKMQVADLFTKALGQQQFESIVGKLGMQNLNAPS